VVGGAAGCGARQKGETGGGLTASWRPDCRLAGREKDVGHMRALLRRNRFGLCRCRGPEDRTQDRTQARDIIAPCSSSLRRRSRG
jgi:hypothetical protein